MGRWGATSLEEVSCCELPGSRIDIDNGSGEATLVTQTDGAGRKRVHTVPANWTGDILTGGDGQGTLDLSSLAPQPGWSSTATAAEGPGFDPTNVVRLEVKLGSSGAVDDLCFELATPQLRRPHLRRAGDGTSGGVRPIWR